MDPFFAPLTPAAPVTPPQALATVPVSAPVAAPVPAPVATPAPAIEV
jgi:hypothetical protein